jgi:hypothetical protein
VSDDDLRFGGRSVIDVLDEDHAQILRLLGQLPAAPGRPVIDVLVATLSRHLCAEEQYLYPTVRAVLDDGAALADAELAADRAILRALRQARATPGRAAFELVGSLTRSHVRRLTSELLPRVRASCTPNELARLGNRAQIAYDAAPTRPHPAAPMTPPANKLSDPAIGVIDKIVDALTGRVTWPEDL